MKAVVTGGAGFIGSHLCDALIKKGFEVACVDNLITGTKENIEHLLDNPKFEFLEQDIVEGLKVDGKIDWVFDLASPASPIDYQEKPIETLLVGSVGVKNVLDFCMEKKAKLLHTSTSEVYGDPAEHPQKESYWGNVNCVGPRSCYDEAKRFGEALIMAYQRKFSLDSRVCRIFNTYGPRMRADDGRVIPNFICQALNNKPLTVYGDGKQTRSFCFVSDMVAGILALAESDYALPVNLGTPSERTILELAEKIIELTNSKSKTEFRPLPEDDPVRRCPDISLAKKELNWQPKIGWEQGLKETIEFFKGKC